MKKVILLSCLSLFLLTLSSCGPHMYRTQSSGKDNVSYITVLTEGPKYPADAVVVIVDEISYPYEKVQKVKKKVKSMPLAIEPGKHNVKVVVYGEIIRDEDLFLSVQESKIFIIK